jgi:hypothetical protein
MHSKVFLARAGTQCWLWTGSHNLTASAAQGVNCEAAVLLEGSIDEPPFRAALAHLEQCKQEAVVFNPFNPPTPLLPQDFLIIHAECLVGVRPTPWFVHLRPATTSYDRLMLPPVSVWLYLYPAGTLEPGGLRPQPTAAYSGTITALNFTEHHPQRGIPADWQGADYVIEQEQGVFHLTETRPHTKTPTQGVFRIEQEEDPSTVWLTENPTPKMERVVGEEWFEVLDPEFQEFFTPRSLREGSLVHREYRDVKGTFSVARKEIGDLAPQELVRRLDMAESIEIDIKEAPASRRKFDFIYRAKYRR